MGEKIYELRKFLAPEIVFGVGARNLVGQYANNQGINKALLVTDHGVEKERWVKEVKEKLAERGVECIIFSDVSPNPRSQEVMNGVEVYKSENCNGIVSVGGGSPMDLAKGIGIVVANGGNILYYEGVDKVEYPIPPLIFIPTTSGTSADVSQFSIITNKEELVKIAIISKKIVPDVALIDPETTLSMDSYLTACTGMDAMTHAMEAFVSNASSMLTDIHALKAIKVIKEYLPKVISSPKSLEYREKMTFASMEAGLAFSNAILGAVHAMAHSLGGFKDLPHGECNSILLEHVIAYNYDSVPERYDKIAEELGLNISGLTAKEKKELLVNDIIKLKKEVGIVNKLGDRGVSSSDISALAKKAIKDPCMITNPKILNVRDVEVIYEEAK